MDNDNDNNDNNDDNKAKRKTTVTAWLITKSDATLLTNCNLFLRSEVPSAEILAQRLHMDSKKPHPVLEQHVAIYATGTHPRATEILLAKQFSELPPLPPFESCNVCTTCATDDSVCVTLCGEWTEYCVRCSSHKLQALLASHSGRKITNIQPRVEVLYPKYGAVSQLVYKVEYIADVLKQMDDDDDDDDDGGFGGGNVALHRVYGVVQENITVTSLQQAVNNNQELKHKVLKGMYKQTLNTNLSLISMLFHVMMGKEDPGMMYLVMFLIGNEIIIKAGLTTVSVQQRFQKISGDILLAVSYSAPHPIEVGPPFNAQIQKATEDKHDLAVNCATMLELERRALGLRKRYLPLTNFAGSSECLWGMIFSRGERKAAVDEGAAVFFELHRTITKWFQHAVRVDSPKITKNQKSPQKPAV